MDKIYYSYNDYMEDIEKIGNYIKANNIEQIISIYRGSLPMGVLLSNIHNLPLQIIDFQSRDGDTKKPSWIKYEHNKKGIYPFKNGLIVDDVLDSSLTMRTIKAWLEAPALGSNIHQPEYHYITLFGKWNDINVGYIREHKEEWIVFEPWEGRD